MRYTLGYLPAYKFTPDLLQLRNSLRLHQKMTDLTSIALAALISNEDVGVSWLKNQASSFKKQFVG